jgi:NADH-quinone oxidoreductase subunit N
MIPLNDSFLAGLTESIKVFRPEAALVVTFIVALIADLIFRKSKNISGYISLLGFIVTFYFLAVQQNTSLNAFSGMLVIDPFSTFFKFIILITSFIIVLMSFFSDELYKEHRTLGEYYTLVVGMTFGMFLLSSASNLIMIYLAIETMSISSYILSGYTKEIRRASEASLKYVIFGAISSGIMIYGISILFGLTGSLSLAGINNALATTTISPLPLLIASLMIIAGIGYKISAVPFHFWTPDVYEGAPVTITAYLSVASKAAGFAVLIRFVKAGFTDYSSHSALDSAWNIIGSVDWPFIIAILSVLTMTLGNLVAVWQTNLKRLLAYSSIAHAGYLLMGCVVMTDIGVIAVLVYFAIYMIMNLGAFLVVQLVANKLGSEELDDYSGLGYRAPLLSIAMVAFLISLTGIPPTAGFIGKLFIFTAVVKANYIWLAVVGVLNSVVSLYYYVKIIRNMYLRNIDDDAKVMEFPAMSLVLILVLAVPTLVFGLFYTPIVAWAESSVKLFVGMP